MKAVIVTGSRIWKDYTIISRALSFHAPELLVTGACRQGADEMAEDWARRMGVDYVGMPARWDNGHGCDRAAGFKRNIRMLEAYPGALVLAFPEGEARGTKHCVAAAEKRGHPVLVYGRDGEVEHRTLGKLRPG